MTPGQSLVVYIKKLNHPLKEIRERSLHILLAKLQLGWEFEDELGATRELFEALLVWFEVHKFSIKREVLELLLTVIKTKGGTYVCREFGIVKLISRLEKVKECIDSTAVEILENVLETLRFMSTVDSDINLGVPPLKLSSDKSSDTNGSYYNNGLTKETSKETSISNSTDKFSVSHTDGICCLLFPWVELSPSDTKTMTLIEDSLKLLKSTRRCCRFIKDVFLRDFPAEIFLNRPLIIKNLFAIADGQCGGHPGEALHVLLCLTQTFYSRLLQLFCVDLISDRQKVSANHEESEDNINIHLQQIIDRSEEITPTQDSLLILRQLPVPIYALDAMNSILTLMNRSVVIANIESNDAMDLKELHTCLSLLKSLIDLLLKSVDEQFWSIEHNTKTYRDIAHKACIVMRALGDLIEKYRKSFNDNPERVHDRIAWLRLIPCGTRLLDWTKHSALPPSTLVTALQLAQIDQPLDLMFPSLSKRIGNVLTTAKSSIDHDYKTRYKELTKLYESMDHAVQFMIKKDSCRNTEDIFTSIENALPILQLNVDGKYFKEMATVLLQKTKELENNDSNWPIVRNIALHFMAHSNEKIRVTFYKMLLELIQSVFVDDSSTQSEKCLTLICHVEILTEICCQGLSASNKEVESSASELMLYLLRGRLVLSESSWWRLLASLLPVLPLLHVYAAHDTQLGKAICKSLEPDIVECMGVSNTEMVAGLVRLMFVKCPVVQLDAAHSLCRVLDESKYLPPRESLRADIILNALRRIEPQNFNIDETSSPSKSASTTGLTQILEVLKQDLSLNDEGTEYVSQEQGISQPALEPSLRRSTLQQLAVMMRQQEIHEAFLDDNGLNLIVSLLRLSLMVDDFLAFPECAISCVSILNSVGFRSRHLLAKISDLPLLLLRVILVFPANDSNVLLAVQLLALIAWAGFLLQELDSSRRKIAALPLNVTQRTFLPFPVNSYWKSSPNMEHSRVEWLVSEQSWQSAVYFRWWWVSAGGAASVRTGRTRSMPPALTQALPAAKASCLTSACSKALLALENATSHQQVDRALQLLQSYVPLLPLSSTSSKEFGGLPWGYTKRFLRSPPASSKDIVLLSTLLQFIISYMDHVPNQDGTMAWIKSAFIGNDAADILSLLSRERLYPQQTTQEDIELTQLRIHVVKVLLRCIVLVDNDGEYSCNKMESLIKILLACLDMIDLKNFHMLGYLNELMRCIRYALHSRYCKLSEDVLIQCLRMMTKTLNGCASSSGRKGQGCRFDAMLSLLVLLKQIHEANIPVQRWSEWWSGEVIRAVVHCSRAERTELRAAALRVTAALAAYVQLLPYLQQCLPDESLAYHALQIFCTPGEANVVRSAAATLLTTVTTRTSHSQVFEGQVLQAVAEVNFINECIQILVDFCSNKDFKYYIKPNVPLTVLEREAELEVRSQKSGDIRLSPTSVFQKPPPTSTLVSALADVINNLSSFKNSDVRVWNEQGLYRILFRCVSCEEARVRASACGALSAGATQRCVRAALATSVDCLHHLLTTITSSMECDSESSARTQSLFLLATLLLERSAFEYVWAEFMNENKKQFFFIILQSLESESVELQKAAIFCLCMLVRPKMFKKLRPKHESGFEFFENVKSLYYDEVIADCLSAGDGHRNEHCQPEYICESYCKVLMKLYQQLFDSRKCLASQDERWTQVCSCLSSLLTLSPRSRLYCVHRYFPRVILLTLQSIRDSLSLQGKSAEVIRNANNEPTLATLHWLLVLMGSLMYECQAAKDSFAEEHIEISLNRLWLWCMMTEQLREALMNLLVNFTNECPKAWASMCVCVSGRSLVGEVCSLCVREAAKPRTSTFLALTFRILKQCSPHHHCRAIILKSDVLCAAAGARGGAGGAVLCEALARSAEGAARVVAALRPPAPRRLLPALVHAAHHARPHILHAADLLELLSSCLVTGDISEVVLAGRAVWALAANNHRAKLVLRSAGITSAVQTTIERLQNNPDVSAQRALELLTYTNTVLQAT